MIERFGRKVMPYRTPGLHYKLPWPIERLTRVKARGVRVVEIGFRSAAASGEAEPAAYEWNVQHRSGRFQRRPEESLMLTGDQNMIEAERRGALRHDPSGRFPVPPARCRYHRAHRGGIGLANYRLDRAARRCSDHRPPGARSPCHGRAAAQARSLRRGRARAARQAARRASFARSGGCVPRGLGAFEEKNRLINEAEGYRNEQVALARGNAEARLQTAAGYKASRTLRAEGDGSRFELAESAFASAPSIHQLRLYLESMEQVLPGKKKLILDSAKGRRHLLLLEDGVEVAPPGSLGLAP